MTAPASPAPPRGLSRCLSALLALLAGCTQSTIGTRPGGHGADDSTPPVETGDPLDTVGGIDTDTASDSVTDTAPDTPPETWPKECPEMYAQDELQTFELDFSPEEWRGLRADCSSGLQQYRPVDFTWNGEMVSAMARLKGNWSWSCDKLQFVVSFNEEDPAGRFHGVRKLMLDAPWYDRTLLHERLAFPFFAARGLPYSCVNNAKLVVNGEYYGVYANVERIDHEYLERNYEEPDGNLYQGGTELKTNEDVADTSDIVALGQAVTIDQLDALVDLDEAVSEWATEAMLPAMDNYWAGVEINYYLYDHPTSGFVYLPYDLDITFGDAAYTSGELVWPDAAQADPITYEHYGWLKEDLVKRVLADPTWCARFVEELTLARAAYSPEEMTTQAEEWDAQLTTALDDDVRKPFSTADHEASLASLETFLVTRAEFVDAWLAQGDHCPARW